MLNGHGDNAYLFNNKITANFSSNVYHKGTSTDLINYLTKSLHDIGKYPEVAAESLVKVVANHHKLNKEQVLITNGATEAFYIIALLYKTYKSTIFTPSFSEYEDSCVIHNHDITFIPNNELTEGFNTDNQLVWLCNPNNPDGKIIPKKTLENIIISNPNSLFIVDEAYTDFTTHDISLKDKIGHIKNLIIVRSLTKKFAIPGLRLGYILADESIILSLLKVKSPWSVNSLAIEAGKYILSQNNNNFNIDELIIESKRLQNEISEIENISITPSDTTYFLIKTPKNATMLRNELIEKHGILVRDASNFRNIDNQHIRVSIQNKETNNLLIKALKECTKS